RSTMFGLRQKLLFGFGGLLLIQLVVSGLGVAVMHQHRTAWEKFLDENWRSVEYGQKMLDALARLDDLAKPLAGQQTEPTRKVVLDAVAIAALKDGPLA